MKGTGSEDTTDPFRVCGCHTRQPVRVDYKVFQLPKSGSRGRGVLVLMLTSCVPDWIILDATDLVKFTFIRPVYWERSSGTWLAVAVIILASPPSSSPPPPPPPFKKNNLPRACVCQCTRARVCVCVLTSDWGYTIGKVTGNCVHDNDLWTSFLFLLWFTHTLSPTPLPHYFIMIFFVSGNIIRQNWYRVLKSKWPLKYSSWCTNLFASQYNIVESCRKHRLEKMDGVEGMGRMYQFYSTPPPQKKKLKKK